MTSDMKAQLLALNIADDYFKAKRQAELLDEDLQNKDREIYDLKQQIVELSMTLDDLTAPAEGKRTGKR
jgi:cell division protein ZapA